VLTSFISTPSITPAGLTFTVAAAPQRNVDLFSNKFLNDPQNTFQSGTPSGDYTAINLSGSPSYAYGAHGCTISGSVTGQGVLKSKVFPAAPYMFSEIVVYQAPSNASTSCGFCNPAVSQYALSIFNGTTFQLVSKVGTSPTSNTAVAYTPTSYPFTMRTVMEYPELQLWVTDGNGTRLMMWMTMSANVDLRSNAQWQTGQWSPYFSAQSNTNAAWNAIIQSFRSGYTGSMGTTNLTPITLPNGQPYVAGGKAYYWATCNNGNSFKAGHGGIISVDLSTYAVAYQSLFFFNVSSSSPTNPSGPFDTTTSLSVGKVIYDGTTFTFLLSSWGYGDATTGVQIYTASTTTNVLSGNSVYFLNAYELAMPSSASASYYDVDAFLNGGTWNLVAAQTNALTGWTSFAPSLLTGSSLSSLSLSAGPSTTAGEGPKWTQIGGTKYITSSGNAGSSNPHMFNANLTSPVVFPGTIDVATYPPLSTGYYSHYAISPITLGNQTQYLLAYMDNSSVTPVLSGTAPQGMRGAAVFEVSQLVSGNEHF
jgi:hypothetical protein